MRVKPELLEKLEPIGEPTSRWLTTLGIGVAVAMLVLGGAALLQARLDTWQQAQQAARNLLLALDRDIARNLTILDLSVQGVIDGLADPGINQATPSVRHHALFDRSATAEDLGSILVLDVDGNVIEDSTSLIPHVLALGDRDYFQVHRDRADVGMYVSRPFRSRLANGDLRFSISRRISAPDGAFGGVVQATLRLNFFRRLFDHLELGSKGIITLVRTDGRVLTRYPFAEEVVDRDFSQNPGFLRMSQEKSGQYVAKSAVDGVERLYTFRQIGTLPLLLAVNLSTAEVFAPWWHKALIIGPVLCLLCAAAVTSCLLFRREVLRRGKAEHSLSVAADKLSVIAATDGLTGLSNRRAFETEFDRAFRRMVRNGGSLSVIMFDADFFKRYNDRYGHIAGDDVLRSIAGCLAQNLRRPDDVSARYGGEEFVAVLPDTDFASATAIGDRIRLAVEQLAIPHEESPIRCVTVSVGVATANPFVGDDASHLLQAADHALYAAKRQGRNRVCGSQIVCGPYPSLFIPRETGAETETVDFASYYARMLGQ